jgi:raffinose/stachyose/melibiose transport system permease protein
MIDIKNLFAKKPPLKKRKHREDSAFIFMKKNKGEKAVHIVVFAIFAIYALSLLFPLVWLFVQSLFEKSELVLTQLREGPFALPKKLYFKNYIEALSVMEVDEVNLIGMFINSAWYIILAETWCTFWPVMVGYIFSKYKFRGRETFYAVIIFTLTIPIMGTTGAMYKLVDVLNIYDTGPMFVIITGIGGFGGNFLIYYGIFKGISWDYAEAVFIDGGGNFTAFVRVMLPQAMPAISALMVSALIGYWNEYMQFLMYMPSTPTIATGLYRVKETVDRVGRPIYYSGLILSMIPVLILYGFMAGKMMKNLSIGGLKG